MDSREYTILLILGFVQYIVVACKFVVSHVQGANVHERFTKDSAPAPYRFARLTLSAV